MEERMKLEFELKKVGSSKRYNLYEVNRKGLYVGLLSVDKELDKVKKLTME